MSNLEEQVRGAFGAATDDVRLPAGAAARARRGARRTQRLRGGFAALTVIALAGGAAAALEQRRPGAPSSLTVVTGTPKPSSTRPAGSADSQEAPYWFLQRTTTTTTTTTTQSGAKTTSTVTIDSWLGHNNPYYYGTGAMPPYADLIFDPKYTPGVYGSYIDWDEGWRLPTDVASLRRQLFLVRGTPMARTPRPLGPA